MSTPAGIAAQRSFASGEFRRCWKAPQERGVQGEPQIRIPSIEHPASCRRRRRAQTHTRADQKRRSALGGGDTGEGLVPHVRGSGSELSGCVCAQVSERERTSRYVQQGESGPLNRAHAACSAAGTRGFRQDVRARPAVASSGRCWSAQARLQVLWFVAHRVEPRGFAWVERHVMVA